MPQFYTTGQVVEDPFDEEEEVQAPAPEAPPPAPAPTTYYSEGDVVEDPFGEGEGAWGEGEWTPPEQTAVPQSTAEYGTAPQITAPKPAAPTYYNEGDVVEDPFTVEMPSFAGRVAQAWDEGWDVVHRGEMGAQILYGNDNDELRARLAELKDRASLRPEYKVGLPEKIVTGFAKTVPVPIEMTRYGAERAGIMGLGVGAMAAPTGVPAAPMAAGAAKVGFVSGTMQKIFEVEGGNAYLDLEEMGVEPSIARNVAFGVGAVNAAIELPVLGWLVKMVPGGKTALKKVMNVASKEVAERISGSIGKRVALKTGEALIGYGGEVAQEVVQEATNIVGEKIARELSNKYKGTDVKPPEPGEIKKRLWDTAKQSLTDFAVMAGLPGVAGVAGEYRRGREEVREKDLLEKKRTKAEALANELQTMVNDGRLDDDGLQHLIDISPEGHPVSKEAKKILDTRREQRRTREPVDLVEKAKPEAKPTTEEAARATAEEVATVEGIPPGGEPSGPAVAEAPTPGAKPPPGPGEYPLIDELDEPYREMDGTAGPDEVKDLKRRRIYPPGTDLKRLEQYRYGRVKSAEESAQAFMAPEGEAAQRRQRLQQFGREAIGEARLGAVEEAMRLGEEAYDEEAERQSINEWQREMLTADLRRQEEESAKAHGIAGLIGYLNATRTTIERGDSGERFSVTLPGPEGEEVVSDSSTYPAFLEEVGYSREAALNVMDRALAGEELSEKDAEVWDLLVDHAREWQFSEQSKYEKTVGKDPLDIDAIGPEELDTLTRELEANGVDPRAIESAIGSSRRAIQGRAIAAIAADTGVAEHSIADVINANPGIVRTAWDDVASPQSAPDFEAIEAQRRREDAQRLREDERQVYGREGRRVGEAEPARQYVEGYPEEALRRKPGEGREDLERKAQRRPDRGEGAKLEIVRPKEPTTLEELKAQMAAAMAAPAEERVIPYKKEADATAAKVNKLVPGHKLEYDDYDEEQGWYQWTPKQKGSVVLGATFVTDTLDPGAVAKKLREKVKVFAEALEATRKMAEKAPETGQIATSEAQLASARAEVSPEPSEAQKEAGNYRKGHITIWPNSGYSKEVSIETGKGMTRRGEDREGQAWEQVMKSDYGHILGVPGKDGDLMDVFVGPDMDSAAKVFVVNQRDPNTGKFDEHKVLVGFSDRAAAKNGYLENYEPGWKGIMSIMEYSPETFHEWTKQLKADPTLAGQKAPSVSAIEKGAMMRITEAARETEAQVLEEGVAINPKVEEVVIALNDAGIRTTMSGDLYGDELMYIDLDPDHQEALDRARLPEGWVKTYTDITLTNRDVLGTPIPAGREGYVKNLMKAAEDQPMYGRRRIAKKGASQVSPKEAQAIADAIEKPPPAMVLKPTEPTTAEKIELMRQKGEVGRVKREAPARAVIPEEKIKAPTTGVQRGMFGPAPGETLSLEEAAAAKKKGIPDILPPVIVAQFTIDDKLLKQLHAVMQNNRGKLERLEEWILLKFPDEEELGFVQREAAGHWFLDIESYREPGKYGVTDIGMTMPKTKVEKAIRRAIREFGKVPAKTTQVIDKEGKPLVVYHGTNASFDNFAKEKRELGFHFGVREEQARDRIGEGGFSRIIRATLDIRNPLDIGSDLGHWTDMEMLREYLGPDNYEIFTDAEMDEMETADDVRRALQEKGYDGIKYINAFEGGKGADNVAWIAFEPEQIKILAPEKKAPAPIPAKRKAPAPRSAAKATNLLNWIVAMGGLPYELQDFTGELRDSVWQMKKGRKVWRSGIPRGFINKSSTWTLDDLVSDAIIDGWLPEGSDGEALWQLILQDLDAAAEGETRVTRMGESILGDTLKELEDRYGPEAFSELYEGNLAAIAEEIARDAQSQGLTQNQAQAHAEEVLLEPEWAHPGRNLFYSGAEDVTNLKAHIDAKRPLTVVATKVAKTKRGETKGRTAYQALVEYAAQGGRVLVDSGAYSAFRGKAKPVDFDKVMSWYASFIKAVKKASPAGIFDVQLVMPDVIGDQDATIDLLSKYAVQIRELRNLGATPFVALQKGKLAPYDVLKAVRKILSMKQFTVALPSREAAYTTEEVKMLLSGKEKPDRIHFLGMSDVHPDAPARKAVVREMAPSAEISWDATRMRAILPKIQQAQRDLLTDYFTQMRERDWDVTEIVGNLLVDNMMTEEQVRDLARWEDLNADAAVKAMNEGRFEEWLNSELGDYAGSQEFYASIMRLVNQEIDAMIEEGRPSDKLIRRLAMFRELSRDTMAAGEDTFDRFAYDLAPKPTYTANEADVRKAFPTATKITRYENFNLFWQVDLPNGARIHVFPNREIVYDEAKLREQIESIGEVYRGTEYVAGRYFRDNVIDELGIIEIAKLGKQETLTRHEPFHAACNMALTNKQRERLFAKYGNEEKAAIAYTKWDGRTPETLFEHIRDFFLNIYEALFAPEEQIFRKIRTGRIWHQKFRHVGPSGIALNDLARPEVHYAVHQLKWAYDPDNSDFGTVNKRLKNELEIFERLFGPSGKAVILPAGKYMAEKHFRSIAAFDLGKELDRVVKSGEAARILNPDVSRETLADERGLKGKERDRFIREVTAMRRTNLMIEVDRKGLPILTANGKAGMSADFLLATCHPTAPCKECYAAKTYFRYAHAQKAMRDTLNILVKPKAWAERVASEAKKVSKADLPFIRLQGSGDITFDEQIEGYNHLAQIADRPIQVFSRHHDNLAKLVSTPNAPFIKMGSVDHQLFDHYGLEFLKENFDRRGIVNAWLYTAPDEIPMMQKLQEGRRNALGLILSANHKLHNTLTDKLRAASCPCDADERTYIGSCRRCAMSEAGCFMAYSPYGVDKDGKLWRILDPAAPDVLRPVTAWFLDSKQLKSSGYLAVFESIIRKNIDLVNGNIARFWARERDHILLKDIRWPNDTIKVYSTEAARIYQANMMAAIARAKKGDLYLPGGEIQPSISMRNGVIIQGLDELPEDIISTQPPDGKTITEEEIGLTKFALSPGQQLRANRQGRIEVKKVAWPLIKKPKAEVEAPAAIPEREITTPGYVKGTKVERRAIGAELSKKEKANVGNLIKFVQDAMRKAGLNEETINQLDIEFKKVIDPRGKDITRTLEEHAALGKKAGKILGATTFYKLNALVELALNQDRRTLEGTAYHEAFHVALQWLLPEKDYATIMRLFRWNEEAAADAFSHYMQSGKWTSGKPQAAQRYYMKIRAFLQRLRSWVLGKGFSRPEDIFGQLRVGMYQEPVYRRIGREKETLVKFNAEDRYAPWMYSRALQVAEGKFDEMPKKVQSLMPWLRKQGVKPAELDALEIDQWIRKNHDRGKIDKAAFLNYLMEQDVVVNEQQRTSGAIDDLWLGKYYPDGDRYVHDTGRAVIQQTRQPLNYQLFIDDKFIADFHSLQEAQDQAEREGFAVYRAGGPKPVEYKQYAEKGDVTYRELLFFTPTRINQRYQYITARMAQLRQEMSDLIKTALKRYREAKAAGKLIPKDKEGDIDLEGFYTPTEYARIEEVGKEERELEIERRRLNELEQYATHRSQHFGNATNLMGWARFTERYVGDKKWIYVEELQSDWMQQARDSGMMDADAYQKTRDDARTGAEEVAEYKKNLLIKYAAGGMQGKFGIETEDGAVFWEQPDGTWGDGDQSWNSREDLVRGMMEHQIAWHEKFIPGENTGIPRSQAEQWAMVEQKASKEELDKFAALLKRQNDILDAQRRLLNTVPHSPWMDHWYKLLMKRLIRLTAEEGFDGIALTTAARQFKQWGTDQFYWEEEIGVDNKPTGSLIVYHKTQVDGFARGFDLQAEAEARGLSAPGEKGQVMGVIESEEDLLDLFHDQVGTDRRTEDKARKLWARIKKHPKTGIYRPRQEGMEAFYDDRLQSWLGKYVKKWDAKIEPVEVFANRQIMRESEMRDFYKAWTREELEDEYSASTGNYPEVYPEPDEMINELVAGDIARGEGYYIIEKDYNLWASTELIEEYESRFEPMHDPNDMEREDIIKELVEDDKVKQLEGMESFGVVGVQMTPLMRKAALFEGQTKFRIEGNGTLEERARRYLRDLLEKARKSRDEHRRAYIRQNLHDAIPQDQDVAPEPSSFEEGKDEWIGEKDIQQRYHANENWMLKEWLKEALGEKKYTNRVKDYDKAIHVYLDLKRNPLHYDLFYDDLTPEQQRIANLARTIEQIPEVHALAEYIAEQYDETGLQSMEEGIIHNTIENYVARTWNIPDKRISQDTLAKFKASSRHSKQRVFQTILQGQSLGYNLKIEGAVNNLSALKDEISRVREDKRLLKTLLKMNWRDNVDANGKPLKMLSVFDPGYDYEKIDHPNFAWWHPFQVIRGAAEIKNYGKDTRILRKWAVIPEGKTRARRLFEDQEDAEAYAAELWEKQKTPTGKIRKGAVKFRVESRDYLYKRTALYAPKEYARRLNRMVGVSKLKGIVPFDILTKYNAYFKNMILITSFFHHQAFIRSLILPGGWMKLREHNFMEGYRQGLEAIRKMDPELQLLIRNGLTISTVQDWEEDVLRSETNIFGDAVRGASSKLGIKFPVDFINWMENLRQRQADFLFGSFGAGLKAKAALMHYQKLLKEYGGEKSQNEIAKMAAELINADFGGLHLQRMERDPTRQHIFRLVALAPDWTESNIITMYKSFITGDKASRKMYRRFWASVLTKGILATFVANILLGFWDEDDQLERLMKAWKAGNLKWLDIDITPLYRALGGKGETRKYLSVLGHFKDPIKFMTNLSVAAHHKGSVLYRAVFEWAAGVDWKGARFTTASELMGWDDKGYYLTDTGEHKRGQPKGGKEKGKLTTFAPGRRGPVWLPRLPSYLLSQLRGFTPVQVQALLATFAGEQDAWDLIQKGLGLHGSSTFPNAGKIEEDFIDRWVQTKKTKGDFKRLKDEIAGYNRRQEGRGEEAEPIEWRDIAKKGLNRFQAERIYEKKWKGKS